jgi:hypothetical protein
LQSSVKDCGSKTHEIDPEGIVSNMNPFRSQQSYFLKISFNTPMLQEQEFGFVEHVHIAFLVRHSGFSTFRCTACLLVGNLGQQVSCPGAGIVSFQYP